MNVPKLRFKGFSDDWIKKKIGEITLKVGSGSTPRGGEKVYQSNGIPFIRSQNVNNNFLNLKDLTFIPDAIHKQMQGSTVKTNDILLNITGASIGRSCVVPDNFKEGNVNQHVCIIRLKSGFLSRFIQPFLSSTRGQKLVLSHQVGSGREGLNFQAVRSFSIDIPSFPEQTKIANFLTAIDEKISQLTQKHDLLKQYKKGVMQQIFSQKLRFNDDDGREFPEWKNEIIGAHVDFLSGYPFNGDDISENNNGIQLMRGVNITEGMIRHDSDIDKFYCGETKKLEKYFLELNDLVIGMDGSKVGKNSALIKNRDVNSLLVQRVARLRAKATTSIFFIFQYVNSIFFHSYVDKVKTSSGIPHISAKEIKEFRVGFPCLAEQTKIANFLTAIDDKITLTQTQLEALKQYKKGLLQQMFV